MLTRSHNLKSARLLKKRRRVVLARVALAVFSALGLWGLVFFSSGAAAFSIKDITVSGNSLASKETIAKAAEETLAGRYFFTITKANIFFYPKSEMRAAVLASFPEIANLKIRLKNFHTLAIEVKERRATALWCGEETALESGIEQNRNDCYAMDESGFIFARADQTAPPVSDAPALIIFYGVISAERPVGETYLGTKRFGEFLKFARDLDLLGLSATAFRERADKDIEVLLRSGARLILGREDDLSVSLDNLDALISDESFGESDGLSRVDYIDLRFGNKVYYKLR